jgi:hypothetical protein
MHLGIPPSRAQFWNRTNGPGDSWFRHAIKFVQDRE